jgi:PAS domain S-box-containing protein
MTNPKPESGPARAEGDYAAVERSEQEFRRLLEKLPAGAYTCDSQGLITYFNPQAERVWGRAPKLYDAADRFCGSFKLYASDGTPISHDQCWMALALHHQKEYNGHEIVIERPGGERLTALAHANPLHDESGKLLGAVNILVDITDRKRAEDVLKEADRSKNEFLATLAHELRNPLAPIRNAIQLLHLKGEPSAESKWALEVIERQTQHMTRLIDDLLDIARITGNKLELRRERVRLADVLNAAMETSGPLVEACGQEFVFVAPEEPVVLDGDLTRLAQIISNLLNNAAKYTERGGHVWLIAERQGSDVVITVRDTGIGIPAQMLPGIFEMFSQGERSLEQSRGGLGIGLTLVKRLVELHGGTIEARSDGLGKGSEFIVRLPLVIEPLAEPRSGSSNAETTSPSASLRVMVVDDNRDSAGSMGMLLRLMGNDIRTAADGLEAVGAADEFRPDVMLLDIGLPKLNGFEVAKKIREQPWGRRIVLIAVTGWGQETDRKRSEEAGFDHHLVKPVNTADLMRLMSALGQTRPHQHQESGG